MNPTLAAFYNTNGAGDAARQEQIKIAHLDLFAKAASAQGYDLTTMAPAQVEELYAAFSTKLAEGAEALEHAGEEEEEEGEKDEAKGKTEEEKGEKEKEEAEEEKEAQAQYAAMKQWQDKVAEADHLGRVMAHSFTDERNKIAAAAKVAGTLPPALAAHNAAAKPPAKKKGAGTEEEPKTASAAPDFDRQAARLAIKIASDKGFDGNEALQRMNALFALGVPPMAKTASALGSYNDAVSVRALEFLEAAKYPVDWSQVFGR